jgi:hypothetical protein
MLAELSFTEARKEFTSLYNEAFNNSRAVIIKRKKTEEVALLRADLLKFILSKFVLKPEVLNESDGSVTAALDQLELYANGETLEQAMDMLVQDMKFYALDYMQRSQLFLNAPNRRSHFPYLLRILLCDNDEEVRKLLES